MYTYYMYKDDYTVNMIHIFLKNIYITILFTLSSSSKQLVYVCISMHTYIIYYNTCCIIPYGKSPRFCHCLGFPHSGSSEPLRNVTRCPREATTMPPAWSSLSPLQPLFGVIRIDMEDDQIKSMMSVFCIIMNIHAF